MSERPKPEVILFSDIHEIMTNIGVAQKAARGPILPKDLGIQRRQTMIVSDGKVIWIGSRAKIPRSFLKVKKEISLDNNVYPGFVDCHTHSLFLGNRADEFEKRNQGMSYQEIAAQGGGIMSTVRDTRRGSLQELKTALEKRLDYFAEQGVTTVEVKSGYGLTLKDEFKLLKAIRETRSATRIVSTFLGAHALPPEHSSHETYLEDLKKALPEIKRKKLADRVDIFVEQNYFTVDQSDDYLKAARDLGFQISVHADQLSRTGAAALAVKLGAQSADHVIRISPSDIKELAVSEVTCVLLPTSDLFLRCPYPPARELIDAGARVAVSTDYNPGTSPTQNIQLVGLLARLEMKMTLSEVFAAYTLGGAYALGLGSSRGALTEGYDADFFVSPQNWSDFFYDLRPVAVESSWIGGVRAWYGGK